MSMSVSGSPRGDERKSPVSDSGATDSTTRSITPPREDAGGAPLSAMIQHSADAEAKRAEALSKIPREVLDAAGVSGSAEVEDALEAVASLAHRLLPKATHATADSLINPRTIIGSTTPLSKALTTLIEKARAGSVPDRLHARYLHIDYLSLDGLRKALRKLSIEVPEDQDPYDELVSAIGTMVADDIDLFGEETVSPETIFGVETPIQQALCALVMEAREGGNRNVSLMLDFLGINRYTLAGAEKIDHFVLGDVFTRVQKEHGEEMSTGEALKEAIRRLANDYVLLANGMRTRASGNPHGSPVFQINADKSELENGLKIKKLLMNPFTEGLTKVTSIHIDGMTDPMGRMVKGKLNHLPESIGNLLGLTHLDLPRNNLVKLPQSLAGLNLKKLNIECNRVIEIPDSFKGNSTLVHVNIANNRIIDISPLIDSNFMTQRGSGWSKTPKRLQALNASGNNISEIPNLLRLLPHLRSLNLSRNSITTLPVSLGTMKSLTHLNMSQNNIAHLPENIGELTNLELLNLSSNRIQWIPDSLSRCEKLYSLSVSRNLLNHITSLPPKIEHIDASYNRLTRVDDCFGNCRKLRFINVSHNQLERVTPHLRRIPTIDHLNLEGNETLSWLPPQLQWIHFSSPPLVNADQGHLLEEIGYQHLEYQKQISVHILRQIAQHTRAKDPRYTYYKVSEGAAPRYEEISPETMSPTAFVAQERYVMKKTRWKKDFKLAGMWPL